MRRCYKCGVKKYDDNIVCPECEYKITQSIRARKLSNEGLAANLRAMAATGVSQSQYEEEYLQTAADRLEEMPQRPKGHWIKQEPNGVWTHIYMCSNCGGRLVSPSVDLPKSCGHCDAERERE